MNSGRKSISDAELNRRLGEYSDQLWSIARNMGPDRPDSQIAHELICLVQSVQAERKYAEAQRETAIAALRKIGGDDPASVAGGALLDILMEKP